MSSDAKTLTAKSEKMLEELCIFEWTVKNIDKMTLPIRSPVFSATENANANLYFEVWLQKIYNQGYSPDFVSLQVVLRKLSGSSACFDLCFKLFVSIHYSDGKLYTEYESESPVTFSSFSSKICINQKSTREQGEILKATTLILKSRLISYGHLLIPKLYYSQTDALLNLRSFSKNFEALYQSHELSDVDIQVGDKTFKSHKFVLAAHSPVFKTMLMQDFKEANTGVIAISDTDPDVFERFLKFLYIGETEDESFINLKQLFYLADKYVQILKQELCKILSDFSLNEEQMDDILHVASHCNDDNLKKVAKKLLKISIQKDIFMQ